MPVILVVGLQEYYYYKSSLGYKARFCLKVNGGGLYKCSVWNEGMRRQESLSGS